MTSIVHDARNSAQRVLAASTFEPAESLNPDAFKSVFRHQPAGVSLVTADDGTRPAALTATSVSSISADPPLLIFSLSALSSSTPVIRNAETVVVHLLTTDDLELAKLGATSGIDRFADTSQWSRLETGEPVFHGAKTWIRGRVLNLLEAGASTVVLVHALEHGTQAASDEERDQLEPLVYHNRSWHGLCAESLIE